MNNKVKQMVYAGLLTALAIIIPIQFSFLKIFVPPAFTATLAAHVPMMLSMLISPFVAVIVGIGSTLGFAITGLPMIVAIPFIGLALNWALIVTLVGSIMHHMVDGIIAYAIVKAVAKSRNKDIYGAFGEFTTQQTC